MFISRLIASDPRRLPSLISPYNAHQALWSLFSDGPERQRDFLFRQVDEEPPLFLAVSARPPVGLPGWTVQTKPYAPALRPNDRLRFSLRVNPVVNRLAESGRRGQRHDMVMDAKRQARARGLDMPSQELIRAAGLAWLGARAERLGFAFEPDQILVTGYAIRQFAKPKGGAPIRVGTLDFEGELTVLAEEPFHRLLTDGVGPAKGFGCGLMLVRRT